MDFRRIDENTVQCILSEDEMNAYGFQIEDFFSDQERARKFLEHLVERAEEEVGYETQSGMVSMQMMKMSNNDLVITLSERDPNEGFQNMLQHIHQQLASLIDPEVAERLHSSHEEDFETEAAAEMEKVTDQQAYEEHVREIEQKKRQKERQRLTAPRVFRFESLRTLEQFAASIALDKPINSAVFSDYNDGGYYLLLKKGKLRLEEYQMLCEELGEFATLCTSQPYAEQYCKEHFETFIPKQAIKVLRKIETGI